MSRSIPSTATMRWLPLPNSLRKLTRRTAGAAAGAAPLTSLTRTSSTPRTARTLAKDHRSGVRIPSRSRHFVSETVVRSPALRTLRPYVGFPGRAGALGGAGLTMRPVRLLERDSSMASLREYAEDARGGSGRLVLVSGEAGVGKTALLECLEEELPQADWAWGGCDGLSTPRPLGPLFDIAARDRRRPARGLPGGRAARDALPDPARQLDGGRAAGRPTVLVIEDAHWADEATLDLVRFLAPRIRDSPSLLVVTYRDDGLAPGRPAARGPRGAGQPPFAPAGSAWPRCRQAAVRELAADSRLVAASCSSSSPAATRSTSTELLRSGPEGAPLPGSARDAVMARVAVLDARRPAAPRGRRPSPAPGSSRGSSRRSAPTPTRGIDACLASGVMAAGRDRAPVPARAGPARRGRRRAGAPPARPARRPAGLPAAGRVRR